MSKLLANQIANYGDDAPIEIKEGLNIPAGKPIQAAGSAGTSGQVLSSTGTSIAWSTPFDGNYNSLSNKPTIPAAQVNADWNATSGVSLILNTPVVPQQPSVTTSAAGTAALSYNSTNGEFTFTPPDLSGYLTSYTETDPVFAASDAAAVTAAKISNWDTAFGWGNHASAGYLTSYTETQTLDNVLALGATTTRDITTTGKVYFSNNFATTGDLPNATTYHGMFAHVHAEGHGYFAHAGAWTQLLDTGSSISELADVNLAVAPQSGQVLAYDGSNWVATAAGGGGGGIALTDLSVTTASAGTAALTYNNVSGVFTFTPPDLSSYAQTANLSIANWDAAHGWGDHSTAGYLTSYTEADTLDTVTNRGSTTANSIQVGRVNIGSTDQSILVPSGTNDVTFQNTATGGEIVLQANSTITVNNYARFLNGGDVIFNDSQFGTTYFNNGASILGTNSSGVGLLVNNGLILASGDLSLTSGNATITGSLTAGGLTYPTTNGNSGDVLTSNGSGSVTWTAPTGLQSRTTAQVTQTIANGAAANLSITTPKTYVLYSIQTSHAAWVTLYSDTASRTADASRAETTDPIPGSGVLAEVITNGAVTQLITPGTICFNSAASGITYAKVVNKSGSTANVSVTLTYLQLEA